MKHILSSNFDILSPSLNFESRVSVWKTCCLSSIKMPLSNTTSTRSPKQFGDCPTRKTFYQRRTINSVGGGMPISHPAKAHLPQLYTTNVIRLRDEGYIHLLVWVAIDGADSLLFFCRRMMRRHYYSFHPWKRRVFVVLEKVRSRQTNKKASSGYSLYPSRQYAGAVRRQGEAGSPANETRSDILAGAWAIHRPLVWPSQGLSYRSSTWLGCNKQKHTSDLVHSTS